MNKQRNQGFSLIELMIGLTVGVIVLIGLERVFVATLQSNAASLSAMRLNQELRATMEIISRDMKRAGYWGNYLTEVNTGMQDQNPYAEVADLDKSGGGSSDCIAYGYDLNNNANTIGTFEANEWRGFWLDGNTIKARVSEATAANSDDCVDSNGWQALTDPNAVTITNLEFATLGAKTLVLDDSACPGGTREVVIVRSFHVTLEGELTNNADFNRKLEETVRLRNDRYDPAEACPP